MNCKVHKSIPVLFFAVKWVPCFILLEEELLAKISNFSCLVLLNCCLFMDQKSISTSINSLHVSFQLNWRLVYYVRYIFCKISGFFFFSLTVMKSFWHGEEMVKSRLVGHFHVKSIGLSLDGKFLWAFSSSWWFQVYFDLYIFFNEWNFLSFSLIVKGQAPVLFFFFF